MTLWQCLDCKRIGALDKHGRCKGCGSEAVVKQIYVEKEKR